METLELPEDLSAALMQQCGGGKIKKKSKIPARVGGGREGEKGDAGECDDVMERRRFSWKTEEGVIFIGCAKTEKLSLIIHSRRHE